jgi:hypothetical protein
VTGLDTLRHQAGTTRAVVQMNVAGVTHEESLIRPQPAGNCLNWVMGHLLSVYNGVLPLLGQPRVRPEEELARYARGSAPIADADALPFGELLAAWESATAAVDAGLASFPPERLAERAPVSPSENPDETMGTLLSTVLFHQIYHSGQLGVLRRIAGKAGAIA